MNELRALAVTKLRRRLDFAAHCRKGLAAAGVPCVHYPLRGLEGRKSVRQHVTCSVRWPNRSCTCARRRSAATGVDFAPINVEFATFAHPGSCLAVWLLSGNSFWHSFTERPNGVLGARARVCFFVCVKKDRMSVRENEREAQSLFGPAGVCLTSVCVCCERQWWGWTCVMYCDNSVRYVAFMGTPCPGGRGRINSCLKLLYRLLFFLLHVPHILLTFVVFSLTVHRSTYYCVQGLLTLELEDCCCLFGVFVLHLVQFHINWCVVGI